MKEPCWLLDFASNTFSQTGEDGIIQKALDVLPERNRWCVEFGAWDGQYLSNVRRLVEQEDYSAVMIEADPAKFEDLHRNYGAHPKVRLLNRFVGFTEADSLDTLLRPLDVPTDLDFLSIDIDGNDFHVWQAIRDYRPKLVCIEFNPTIPTEVDYVQPADPHVCQGSSLTAMCRLAQEKGYELISVIPFNAFFVDARFFPLYEIADNRPETLRTDLSHVTWFFSGYDGSVHLAGSQLLPWHRLYLDRRRFQVLPWGLRDYPGNYRRIQRRMLRLFRKYLLWRAGKTDTR
ncbi:MAG TPA: hypothetical protein ENN87_10485 [Phycisphaerales bacterium]|nr:hypothetical protein [Phycisphaerales bacterium]